MKFCGSCGYEVTADQRSCATCGRPVQEVATDPGPSQPMEMLESARPPVDRQPWHPSRTQVVLAGAAIAVVGGSVGALTLLRAPDSEIGGYYGTSTPLPDAITDRPDEQWTWNAPDDGEVTSVLGVDGSTLVAWEDAGAPTVIALDPDGRQIWSDELDNADLLTAGIPGREDIVLATRLPGGTTAFTARTGEELWTRDREFVVGLTDEGLMSLRQGGHVQLVDPETGEAAWTAPASALSVGDDAVYLGEQGRLTKVNLSSGDEIWSIDNYTEGRRGALAVAAGSTVVLMSDPDEVFAFSVDDGSELWSADIPEQALGTGHFSGDLFWLTVFTDSQLMKSGITFFDADGLLDTSDLDLAPHDFYFPTVVRSGDEAFLLDNMSGLLLDEQLEPRATYDGDVTPANGGVYVLAPDGELSFATYGSEHKEWTMQLPGKKFIQLEVADEALFVLSDSRVTRYE